MNKMWNGSQPSSHDRVRAARRWALALLCGAMSAATFAAPGTPGVPGNPVTLFLEDFESRVDPAIPEALESYRGARYTADPYWTNHEQCNGIIYSLPSIPPTGSGQTLLGCPDLRRSHDALSRLATGMARFHRVNADTESVLASYTRDETVEGSAGVVFETIAPIPVPSNRFVTIGADISDRSCATGGNPARYNFSLVGSTATIGLSKSDINACNGRPIVGPAVIVASLKGNQPMLTNVGGARIRIRNENDAWAGNDAALDNIGLFDVTPQLDKQFARGPLASGAFGLNAPARMTFTITNTTDLLEKAGWSFVETLPDGLVIAPTPNLTVKDCVFPVTPVAAPGSRTLSVSNGTLREGNSTPSCSISVDVTSTRPGTYTNNRANISSLVGLDEPGDASVTFVKEPVIRLQKLLNGARVKDTDQFSLSITDGAAINVEVTTSGTGASILNGPAMLSPATAGVRYTLSELTAESPVGSTNLNQYDTRYSCTNAAAGGQTPSGSGTSFAVTPVAGDDLTCIIVNSPLAADLQVVKTASAATLRSGDLGTFTLVATNAGPAAVNNAVLRDAPGAGLDCVTPNPNATCTADGGATCPGATVATSALTSTAGIAIPSMPAGGRVMLSMQCRVIATGLP